MTSAVKSVLVTIPPITTVASGRWISAPALVAIAIGRNPRLATSAVMSTGRMRTSAVNKLASRGDMPSCRACSAPLTHTRPLSTATPNRATKPTPAAIENGIPRSASAATPPEAATGTAQKISAARRNDLKLV